MNRIIKRTKRLKITLGFQEHYVILSCFEVSLLFLCLFNVKAILVEEHQWFYLIHSWGDKGIYTFPKSIGLKMKIIAWLEVGLAYFEAAAKDFYHYAIRTHQN